MKETPARIAPAGAGQGRRAAIGVANLSEGFVAAGRKHGRIVELVTLEPPPGRAEAASGGERRVAVAEFIRRVAKDNSRPSKPAIRWTTPEASVNAAPSVM